MERLTTKLALVGAMKVALLVAVLNAKSNEDANHYCGRYQNGGWGVCDAGHCCGYNNYCSPDNCVPGFCQYYCPDTDPSLSPSDNAATDHHGVEVLARGLGNATRNRYYLDRQIFKPHGDIASSSSSEVLSSCAPSLSRLSPAARRRYPWAALGGVASPNGNITAICGRCLKVTSVVAGGVDTQVKVRIVHTPTIEGLELDRDTFRQLDRNGHNNTNNRLIMVKYQFESC